MKGYEGIAEGLIEEGVETVFGLMAIDNMPFMTHLQRLGMRVVRSRTEHGAVCMADGYARATGKPAVVSVGDGPGAGLTGTALMTAKRRRSPVVLICGDTPALERHNIKHFDQNKFFEVTAGHCVDVTDSTTLAEDMRRVFEHARSGAGPAVLNLPLNLFEEGIVGAWNYQASTEPQRVRPDLAVAEQAIKMLADAERPIILAGRGASDGGAKDAILELAERVGALIGTSMQAETLFEGDPYYLGIIGGLANAETLSQVAKADLILAVGASLNQFTTDFGRIFPKAHLIHVDRRPTSINHVTPVDLAVVGEARATIQEFVRLLDESGTAPRTGLRTEEVRAAIAQSHGPQNVDYVTKEGVLDPREFLSIVDSAMPDERFIVTDAGHAMFFVFDEIKPHSPDDRIWGADFASMMVGIPLGIGTSIARPDKHTVAFVGDGGFMMSIPELDTAVREQIPMTVIVLNDEAYGAEVHYLENWGLPTDIALFETPDLAAIAASLGCESVVVRNREEAEAAVARIGRTDKPYVIDARTNIDVIHRLWVGSKRLSGGK